VWGFGSAIALWEFNAVQQFRADSDSDLCRKVLIAALALMTCCMQIALPNRTPFQLPANRGLVQIADSLIERSRYESEGFQSSELRVNNGEPAPYPSLVVRAYREGCRKTTRIAAKASYYGSMSALP
jgi:hypothetical protein